MISTLLIVLIMLLLIIVAHMCYEMVRSILKERREYMEEAQRIIEEFERQQIEEERERERQLRRQRIASASNRIEVVEEILPRRIRVK
jgi:Sec-independent protein translocase protein TatA